MSDPKPKRKRGRPPKLGDDEDLFLTLPKREYDYLQWLATKGRLGTSVSAVAVHILVREIDEMLKSDYHKRDVPRD